MPAADGSGTAAEEASEARRSSTKILLRHKNTLLAGILVVKHRVGIKGRLVLLSRLPDEQFFDDDHVAPNTVEPRVALVHADSRKPSDVHSARLAAVGEDAGQHSREAGDFATCDERKRF